MKLEEENEKLFTEVDFGERFKRERDLKNLFCCIK